LVVSLNSFCQNKIPLIEINKMDKEKIKQVLKTMYDETDNKDWQKYKAPLPIVYGWILPQ
jgi:hypothetical protein